MVWICVSLIFSICLFHLSTGQEHGVGQPTYCESCLETAKEIENVLGKATSHASRQGVIERVVNGALCQKHKKEDMKTACKHLFESHHEKFRIEIQRGNTENLEIPLCYELSLACVGVQRQSHTGTKNEPTFEEDDITAMLRANKDRVRTTRPLAEMNHKDEL